MTAHLSPASLPVRVRLVIFGSALLQAWLLYLSFTGIREAAQYLVGESLIERWLMLGTLAFTLPTALALSLARVDDKRFWQQLGLLALLQCAVLTLACYNSAPAINRASVWFPVISAMLLMSFVLLPWLQARQMHGSFRVPYADLFELAWQNTLSLLLSVFFAGICWLILWLWAGLFNLLGIDAFYRLFTHPFFYYPATCLLFAQGILLARSQHKAVQTVRNIKFALFKGLLPLLALIALLFILSLPFAGLEPLWRTGHAVWLLTSLIALLVLFTNAVWQDGKASTPYPLVLRRLVEAALLTLPFYAALALYALWLRIDQYGMTSTRFFGLLVVLLISGYALGYAFAVLRSRQQNWLAAIAPVNKLMSWLVIALAVLANSPVLDAYRISASSQLARLDTEPQEKHEKIWLYLRFDNGRAGYQALQKLQAQTQSEAIAEILARTNRWTRSDKTKDKREAVSDIDALRKHLQLAEGSAMPDDNWLHQLLAGKLKPKECIRQDRQCVVRVVDLDGDGKDDVLLCELNGTSWRTDCWIHAKQEQTWRNQGYASLFQGDFKESGQPLEQMLKSGTLQTPPKRWPMLLFEGSSKPADIRLESN